MECRFEIVITVPDGFAKVGKALAERFVSVGCETVADSMREACGESLELVSIRRMEPST